MKFDEIHINWGGFWCVKDPAKLRTSQNVYIYTFWEVRSLAGSFPDFHQNQVKFGEIHQILVKFGEIHQILVKFGEIHLNFGEIW